LFSVAGTHSVVAMLMLCTVLDRLENCNIL
jgi:hypothetical protein